MREDKAPKKVVPDVTIDVIKEIKRAREQMAESSTGSWETLEKQKIISEDAFEVEGQTIKLTNIERHVWKDVTKADLTQYYISISDYILPFLKDRPFGINISLFDPAAV